MRGFPVTLGRQGSPSSFFTSSGGLRFSQYVDLLEGSGLDMSHYVFFKGSRLAESTHLRLLLFHLLPQAGKHLKGLLIGVSGFECNRKDPQWQCGRRLRIFNVG